MSKFFAFIIITVVSFSKNILAQSFGNAVSMPHLIFDAYREKPKNVFGLSAQIASAARHQLPLVGVYVENRYLQKELQARQLAAVYPLKNAGISLQLQNAGFSGFTENILQISYAKQLGNKVQTAIGFTYNAYQVPRYRNVNAVSGNISVQWKVADKIFTGFQVNNPVSVYYNKTNDEKLNRLYRFGLGYEASDELMLCIQFENEEARGNQVIAGLQYSFAKNFSSSIGYSTVSNGFFGSIGYNLKNLMILASLSNHQYLGISPGIMAQMQINQKTKNN